MSIININNMESKKDKDIKSNKIEKVVELWRNR